MTHDKSWYIDLLNRAQAYVYTSYPYTHESLGRADVIKKLRTSVRELIEENEKQAAEIAGLREEIDHYKKLGQKDVNGKIK